LVDESLALSEGLSDPLLRGIPTVNRAAIATEDGDLALAGELLDRALPLAEELHVPAMLWMVLSWRPVLATMRGEFETAERIANECLVLGQEAEQPDAFMMFASQLFCLRFLQGRLDELEAMAVQTIVEGVGSQGAESDCLLAVLYSELDRLPEARAAFERGARDDFGHVPVGLLRLPMLAISAETCARLGDAARARVLYEILAPEAESLVVAGPTCFGSTRRYLGLLATTCGRLDDADAEFAGAAEIHERIGARPWLVRTQVDWARMLILRDAPGDTTTARSFLGRAHLTAGELGMVTSGRAAAALLERLGDR
jgi:hypothetical protein